MEKQKKYVLIWSIIFLTIIIWWIVYNILGNKTIINSGIKTNNQDITNKDKNISNENKDSNTSISKSDERNLLEWIEAEINKEKEELDIINKEKQEKAKEVINKYIADINEDKDIIKYIDINSILKIKKNTNIVFKNLTQVEKVSFIKELKEYWYKDDTFDPNNTEQLYKYINFIVKAWLRKDWVISKIEYNYFNFDNESYIISNVTFNYVDGKKITLKLYLTNWYKLNISN